MVTKATLLKMDPDIRAFTLVGAFMGYFAVLELGVNEALSKVLGLEVAASVVVSRNMSFDDKLKTLRALVSRFTISESKAKEFDELVKRARKCGEIRNTIAHSPFRRSEKTDGVEVFVVSANSSLKFIEMDWSVDRFLGQIDEINTIDNELRAIEKTVAMHRIGEALLNLGERESADGEQVGGLLTLGKLIMEGEI
ncbi:hypothetical protein [Shinella fusca]|uniref:Uncharacterized protein n=1 Tax=Shinella fusca TaxID=544480 RepID=A0A7W8DTN8_9HYPH|nr:hypothetical protein [Shinella fusca]MBB5041898.1 hypothetical protein [Shinella fusca]